MKRLLLALVCVISTYAYSQATANPAPDIVQCNYEIFDLTVQTPIILGNQPAPQFTVSYFETLADATANTAEIPNPFAYVGGTQQIIYARVDNTGDSTFDITSFEISWSSFFATEYPDIAVCDVYTFPVTPVNEYFYTGPNGTGQILPAGTAATNSMTVYVYADNGTCTDETSFQLEINATPLVWQMSDFTICETGGFVLPILPAGQTYHFEPGGASNTIVPIGFMISWTMPVYIFAQSGTNPNCTAESMFWIYVVPSPNIFMPNVTACESYTLPQLKFGATYWTGPQGTGTQLNPGDLITTSMDIYVFVQGMCSAEHMFEVTIGNPVITPQTPLFECDTDGDGFATFNIAQRIPFLLNGVPNLIADCFETLIDAQTGSNPILNLSAYTNIVSGNTIIYYRVSDFSGSCFSVGELELHPGACGTVSGVVRFDADENGCTPDDDALANIQVRCQLGNTSTFAYTNAQGEYTFTDLAPGNYVFSANNYTAGNVTPQGQPIAITGGNSYTANFCVTPIQPLNDIKLYFWPTNQARPGFAANYAMQLHNAGTTVQSGTINLNFDDVKLNFVGATPSQVAQTAGQLQFSFADLQPGQFLYYYITFNVEVPPTVNAGSILSFDAVATTALTDATPADNTAQITQVVVNSYDPNDKTVLQEAFLSDNTQDYLQYIVRFQNTGTADAINVRITDQLDQNLDWSTFRPVASSHSYSAQMDANGLVTFTFNNINLPDSTTNEPASHGFVAYEVKLESGLTVNHSILNTANIYFDFNAPIITNTVMTDLVALLGIGEHEQSAFVLYPNPASHTVNIAAQLQGEFTASVINLQGKVVVEIKGENQASFDVSSLQQGMYFVKVMSGDAVETKKLIVK
jgi:uncharacterized repeat protein (TIGR01451 family)